MSDAEKLLKIAKNTKYGKFRGERAADTKARPLLVGEANPYGADPEFALYPLPEQASGARLARILGMQKTEYLRTFDRVNLCPRFWSAREARERALWIANEPRSVIVLLGSQVTRAFGEKYVPFTTSRRDEGRTTRVILPHPSGRCRLWDEPDAIGRARAAVRLAGIVCGPVSLHCDWCSRRDEHVHCPDCGSTEHVAESCDMEG